MAEQDNEKHPIDGDVEVMHIGDLTVTKTYRLSRGGYPIGDDFTFMLGEGKIEGLVKVVLAFEHNKPVEVTFVANPMSDVSGVR